MTPPPGPFQAQSETYNSTDQGSQLVEGRPVGQVTSSGKN